MRVRASFGVGLSHGLLGPGLEVLFGPVGVFGGIGLPQYVRTEYVGLGASPVAGIRYHATPRGQFSWFFSAQVARFSARFVNDPRLPTEFQEEHRTSWSITVGLDARTGPFVWSGAVGPAWTQYRRRSARGGPVFDEGLKSNVGLSTDGVIPDFELAAAYEF